MPDKNDIKSGDTAEATEDQQVSSSRRSFTQAGLIAAPVVMAIVSRPVLGTTTRCLSNVLSGNLSDPNRGSDQCLKGLNPSSWRDADPIDWPVDQDKPYKFIFGGSTNMTLIEKLTNNPGGRKGTCITAYLNALSDSRYILSTQEVLNIEGNDAYYVPTIPDGIEFLRSTWR